MVTVVEVGSVMDGLLKRDEEAVSEMYDLGLLEGVTGVTLQV